MDFNILCNSYAKTAIILGTLGIASYFKPETTSYLLLKTYFYLENRIKTKIYYPLCNLFYNNTVKIYVLNGKNVFITKNLNLDYNDSYDFILYEIKYNGTTNYIRICNDKNIEVTKNNSIMAIEIEYYNRTYEIDITNKSFMFNENIILDKPFVKWFMNTNYKLIVDDHYAVKIIDSEFNILSLNSNQYLYLTNDTYKVMDINKLCDHSKLDNTNIWCNSITKSNYPLDDNKLMYNRIKSYKDENIPIDNTVDTNVEDSVDDNVNMKVEDSVDDKVDKNDDKVDTNATNESHDTTETRTTETNATVVNDDNDNANNSENSNNTSNIVASSESNISDIITDIITKEKNNTVESGTISQPSNDTSSLLLGWINIGYKK